MGAGRHAPRPEVCKVCTYRIRSTWASYSGSYDSRASNAIRALTKLPLTSA